MIIRKKLEGNYTRIPNEFLLDETISDKARGTLARLLSRPDTWTLNVNHLVKTGKDGHTALRSSLTELEKAGYIHRDVVRGEGGRIAGTRYLVFDHRATPADAENFSSQVKDQNRETHVDDADHMRKTHIRETKEVVTNKGINNQPGVTTTTPGQADEQKPVIESPVLPPPSSFPATEDINSLLCLVPEQHRKPTVEKLISEALGNHSELAVKEAVLYASANVRGGWMQYKAYLDKTLQNQWAEGYLDNQAGMVPALPTSRGRFPNGTVTGCARMDGNYMAAAAFLNRRRANNDQ